MTVQAPDRPRQAATSGPDAPAPPEPPLIIGIDAAEAEGRATGVGRYTLEIVRRWVEAPRPERRYVTFARRREALPAFLRQRTEVVTSERDSGVVSWQQVRLPGLLRRQPVDALFAPAYAIPLATTTPCVVALHDLSFERFPAEFRFRERWRRRLLARIAARRAARVLTISHFSAAELRRSYNLPPDRVTVSYPGVDRFRFSPGETAPSSRPPRPFFLSVGTLLRRRHLDVLIHAFAKLSESFSGHDLVLVGRDRAQPPLRLQRLANELGVAERVRFVDHVNDHELVDFYRTTALHVSLSSYEGFGLPAAEGLASGAPTLLLDQPVYRELWNECAQFVDVPEVEAVVCAMERASGVAPNRAEVLDRLTNRFDWARCADQVDRVLSAAADGSRTGARP